MAAAFRRLNQGLGFWLLIGLGAGALAGLMVWGFLLTHELVEQQIFRGYTHKAARQNPFLAAERLLQQLGRPAQSVRTLSELTPQLTEAPAWVLLNTPSTSLSDTQREALLDWVAEGGTLLFAPQRFTTTPTATDPLLVQLNIQTQQLDSFHCQVLTQKACADLTPTLIPGATPFKVAFDPERILHDTAPPAAAPATPPEAGHGSGNAPTSARGEAAFEPVQGTTGTHLLRRVWGQGQILVFSDLDWLHNRRISDHDHAAFWSHLTQDAPHVWLQYLPDIPPWWWLLAQQAPLLLLASAIGLLLWLLHQAQRFGPALTRPELARRSLLEHIQASGQWLWRYQAAQTLLDAQRHTLRQHLQRKHPGWLNQPPEAQLTYLATLTQWPLPRLERALYTPVISQRLGFVQQVEDLRQLTHLL